MSPSPEIQDLLALHLVPGLGPRLTKALLERFGSAAAVLRASPAQLMEVPHIGSKLAHALSEAMRRLDVAGELELIERHHVRLLALGMPEYPGPLASIYDPPQLLFIRGTWMARDSEAVAIVGSRQCSSYGKRVAERLAGGLAGAGFTIVSGLARGIDGAAHRGALNAGGRTVAVLAGGLSKIYPPEHADLARDVEGAGAVLSESSMTMEPMAHMFPARNRIISGLCRAVVIVEAAQRSGALITARHAAEQGRTVFAVPGNIDSVSSGGTSQLIRNGAILIRGVDDIVEELNGVAAGSAPARAETPADLDDNQRKIWEFLADQPRHIDEMTRHLQLAIAEVTRTLTILELKKIVRRLPGNLYERR
jgi:DNA processing protein